MNEMISIICNFVASILNFCASVCFGSLSIMFTILEYVTSKILKNESAFDNNTVQSKKDTREERNSREYGDENLLKKVQSVKSEGQNLENFQRDQVNSLESTLTERKTSGVDRVEMTEIQEKKRNLAN